jgi:hypothetical protein
MLQSCVLRPTPQLIGFMDALDLVWCLNSRELRLACAAPLARLHQRIENMLGTVHRVCRNVKRWRNAIMALRRAAAGTMEASKGFRRLKACKHLPVLRAGSSLTQSSISSQMKLKRTPMPHSMFHGNACFA